MFGAARVRSILRPESGLARRGLLIAFDGLDGAGKTTIANGVADTVRRHGGSVVLSNWNDTTEIYNLMMTLNASGDLTNDMRCTFGAVELAARYHYVVRPALERGDAVLACKYFISATAHALIRGHSQAFVDRLYAFAPEPDLTVYVDAVPELCLERKLQSGRLGFWESGLDLELGRGIEDALELYASGEVDDDTVAESFVAFQRRLREFHRRLLPGCGNTLVLDGASPADELQARAWASVTELVASRRGDRNVQSSGKTQSNRRVQ